MAGSVVVAFFLGGVLALIAARVLVEHCPPVRRACLRQLGRLGDWFERQLAPDPDDDPIGRELRLVLRRERLRADVSRVQHLLLVDEHMSGTRQIGNRLAYEGLVVELARVTREVADLVPTDVLDTWSPTLSAATPSRAAASAAPYAPRVEILDVGWRG